MATLGGIGPWTRDEALRSGLTTVDIRRRLARGEWQLAGRGLYVAADAWRDVPLLDERLHARAAEAACARYPTAVASHACAAALHELAQFTADRCPR